MHAAPPSPARQMTPTPLVAAALPVLSASRLPTSGRARLRLSVATLLAGLVLGLAGTADAADIEQGRAKAEQICAACHGKDGNTPIDPSYPRLAGQYRDYLVQAMQEYKRDGRKNAIMGAQAKLLSKQEIENLAAYYASLPGTMQTR